MFLLPLNFLKTSLGVPSKKWVRFQSALIADKRCDSPVDSMRESSQVFPEVAHHTGEVPSEVGGLSMAIALCTMDYFRMLTHSNRNFISPGADTDVHNLVI